MASSHAVQTPPLPNWLPKLLRKWEYALGSPDDMPVIALDTDVGVRLFGSRNRIAASDQYPPHTRSGVAARRCPVRRPRTRCRRGFPSPRLPRWELTAAMPSDRSIRRGRPNPVRR